MLAKLLLTITLLLPCGCDVLFPNVPIVPIPDPHVPVVPVPSGAKVVLILHESHDQTPEFSLLKTDLQTGGEAATYLAGKSHTVRVLDVDSTDIDGKPLGVITRLKPKIGTKPLPVLVVGPKDAAGKLGDPTYVESLPNTAIAADVVAVVKKQGG